ncbi:hypothetical protein M409DRAFT_17098 [Zasmidium cellare ATCC 36951]|uniref:AA1-like domain-containing protein n=1 Tax=Zasmidium cellare ATCC 36951 TaxID=1080233 RepID=A0A6A6D4M4_ZASCE|nr:uncharacterized protein M409DRAFT_17098 [Zasmidium cellare ATCC 36951]KAF2173152.1 hypothetical protein M409DRAFT_17098 [Zasmidium cellare ATCC 36951]
MLFIILLAILQLGLALNPASFRKLVKDCDPKIEEIPWQITNFVLFEKKAASNQSSYLAFHFIDVNERLEVNTTCVRTVPLNSTSTLDSSGWTLCKNNNVAFEWDGTTLQLSRDYKDKCLGKPPYDTATAWGRIKPNATSTTAVDGVYGMKTEMHMPITSLS